MAEKLDKNILKMCKSVLNKSDSGSYAKGKDYYKEGCVSSVSFDGDTIEAYCEGNSDYYMTIDCFNGSTNCSCPSPYNPCKHVVALCLWLQQNKPLDTKNIKSILENMPKSEILDMIIKDKQILDKFSFALQIESAETIQGLVNTIRYDPNNAYSFRNQVRMLEKNILKTRDIKAVKKLLQRLIAIYDNYYEDAELEDIMFEFLDNVSQNLNLSEEEVEALCACCTHYDIFKECIYEKGS